MSTRRCAVKAPSSAGFTLLELLVTIGVMGLIAGIGFAAIDRAMAAQAFRTATLQIDRSVRTAHADAIRENRTIVVAPFVSRDPRAAVATASGPFATEIRIEQSAAIRFFSDGTSTGGTIRVSSGRRRFEIAIDPTTGVIASGAA